MTNSRNLPLASGKPSIDSTWKNPRRERLPRQAALPQLSIQKESALAENGAPEQSQAFIKPWVGLLALQKLDAVVLSHLPVLFWNLRIMSSFKAGLDLTTQTYHSHLWNSCSAEEEAGPTVLYGRLWSPQKEGKEWIWIPSLSNTASPGRNADCCWLCNLVGKLLERFKPFIKKWFFSSKTGEYASNWQVLNNGVLGW